MIPGVYGTGRTPLASFKQTTLNNYVLAAAGAAFALTGQAVTLRAARTIGAARGQFTLTGQAVGLFKGSVVKAATGTFALTGQAVTLRATRLLTASGAAFVLTGLPAGLVRAARIVAAGGTFTMTGQQVAFKVDRSPAAKGTFVLTGRDVALRRAGRIPVSGVAFVLTGYAVNLIKSKRLATALSARAASGPRMAVAVRVGPSLVLTPLPVLATGGSKTSGAKVAPKIKITNTTKGTSL